MLLFWLPWSGICQSSEVESEWYNSGRMFGANPLSLLAFWGWGCPVSSPWPLNPILSLLIVSVIRLRPSWVYTYNHLSTMWKRFPTFTAFIPLSTLFLLFWILFVCFFYPALCLKCQTHSPLVGYQVYCFICILSLEESTTWITSKNSILRQCFVSQGEGQS